MTKIKNNPLLKGASDVVVYRQVKGGVVMANKPKPVTSVSEDQLEGPEQVQKGSKLCQKTDGRPCI